MSKQDSNWIRFVVWKPHLVCSGDISLAATKEITKEGSRPISYNSGAEGGGLACHVWAKGEWDSRGQGQELLRMTGSFHLSNGFSCTFTKRKIQQTKAKIAHEHACCVH